MGRGRRLVIVAIACTLAGGAVATVSPARTHRQAATCSAAEKAERQQAVQAYQKRATAQRNVYFRTHRSATARRAFVKKQEAALAALRKSAACTVEAPGPPTTQVPASSAGPPCSPDLSSAGNPSAYNEGTDTAGDFARSTGQLRAVMLFADTADKPRTDDPKVLYEAVVPDMIDWYKEVSYGRLTLTVALVGHWLRMPKDSSAYADQPFDGERHLALMRDAVAAADQEVDFANVDLVYVVGTPLLNAGLGGVDNPRPPIVADGRVLRTFAALYATSPGRSHVMIHETGHTLGLPHATADFWDPMGQPRLGAHFLAWNRWKLHWVDPEQIRCLNGPGTIEETITPIESVGGVKLVVVPTGPSRAVVAELRRSIGHDAIGSGGIVVTTVDATAYDYLGLIVETGGRSLDNAALRPGEKVTAGSVTVEALSASAAAARLRVTRAG